MVRQGPQVEPEVVGLAERNRVPPEQPQAPRAPDRVQPGLDRRGVDLLGRLAGEPQEHGAVAAVTTGGRGQRAEELDHHLAHGAEAPRSLEIGDEGPGRAHGPDRVRAAGTDADLEQVEHADGRLHGFLVPAAGQGSTRVPPRPFSAAPRWSGSVMIATLPPASRNSTTAWILGSMLPGLK